MINGAAIYNLSDLLRLNVFSLELTVKFTLSLVSLSSFILNYAACASSSFQNKQKVSKLNVFAVFCVID